MRTLIFILILSSFLQSTIFALDLVLLILLSRSFIVSDKSSFYLAFFFGLLVSHLSGTTLGVQSLVYLLVVQIARIFSRMHVASSLLTIIPLTILAVIFNTSVLAFVSESSLYFWPKIAVETVLALPVFLLVKLWEERFVVRKEIKLRV